MSATMRAWVMDTFGPPGVLTPRQLARPEPAPGELRVAVRAVAVARTKDVATRAGHPPFAGRIAFPHVLGTEHAGVVDAVGEEVDPALLGTRVAVSAVLNCGSCLACCRGREEACRAFALIGVDRQGSYAEHVVVPEGNVHPLPDDLPFAQAAALAANGPVAHAQLDAGGVTAGSTVAVMGSAGALGSTAVALARHRGATVLGVDRAGRDGAFDGEDPALAEKLLAHTGGWGVDCVIDNLGLRSLWQHYRPALADMGRVVVSGAIGREPLELELLPFYLRSQSLVGVRTGNRAAMRALWADVWAGLRLPDACVSPRSWADLPAVHADVEEGRARAQSVLVR